MSSDKIEICLADLLKEGDENAFKEIYFSFYKAVLYFIGQYIQNPESAKDLAQETFYYLWENRERLDPSKGYKAYLLSIARSKALNYLRDVNYGRIYADSVNQRRALDFMHSLQDNVLEGIVNKDLLDKIYLEVNRLPQKQKEVFILSRKKYFTNKQIAQKLNISIKTVEWRLMVALRQIKKNIDNF